MNKWRVRPTETSSALSNDHMGLLDLGDGRSVEVVDVKFGTSSIFTRKNGWGYWPSVEQLCRFVMREGYPRSEDVLHWVRYMTRNGAVYRLYILSVEKEVPDEN